MLLDDAGQLWFVNIMLDLLSLTTLVSFDPFLGNVIGMNFMAIFGTNGGVG
jgi:hypothetical protein